MKKNFLFALSIAIASGITIYIKSGQFHKSQHASNEWKTFIKKSGSEIVTHKTTREEFLAAKITPPVAPNADDKKGQSSSSPARSIASISGGSQGFMMRKDRILMGEIDQKYEDEDTQLNMQNKVNPKWKEIMGKQLMRFQPEETKIMVKEEVPVIKIQDGVGRFLQQVSITYMQKDGFRSSYRALVDSGTGSIVETWDRSIFEQVRKTRGELTLPSVDNGITTK